MFGRNGESKYNQQMMNRAITSLVLRVVVAGYIIFIGYNVITGTRSETSTIPVWAGSLIGALFIAAAAGFIIYAVISFLKSRESARLDADEIKEENLTQEPELTIAEKVRAAQEKIDDGNNKNMKG